MVYPAPNLTLPFFSHLMAPRFMVAQPLVKRDSKFITVSSACSSLFTDFTFVLSLELLSLHCCKVQIDLWHSWIMGFTEIWFLSWKMKFSLTSSFNSLWLAAAWSTHCGIFIFWQIEHKGLFCLPVCGLSISIRLCGFYIFYHFKAPLQVKK